MAQLDPAADANRKVDEEDERFRAALPALLEDAALRGRWVLFKDGAVVAAFDDMRAAHEEGERRFGRYGGFLVAPVEPERVYRIGGGFHLPDDVDE
jgi:hypothetical protein